MLQTRYCRHNGLWAYLVVFLQQLNFDFVCIDEPDVVILFFFISNW